ncbi:hypothetical protein C7S16_1902 [Burkholderia thailandensis]|uniref:Uncharacterized protein n=1 Tax=Burkholderia thailandensis TaxID=57975 RepID=A0AAW9D5T1_BURTH|nr:hypothetical protein [Burkholderia thailandensis]MDW9257176.1 hypothetical protein [Burkholderia thailandensis]
MASRHSAPFSLISRDSGPFKPASDARSAAQSPRDRSPAVRRMPAHACVAQATPRREWRVRRACHASHA